MNKVRILSLGAGVQSSAVLLMADREEIPRVELAIFADTQAEPREVYVWLEKLKNVVRIPILIATRGNIASDVIDYFAGKLRRVGQPPLFSLAKDGTKGMLRRHCTNEYKIAVIDRALRNYLGYRSRQRMKHKVEVVMGISFDEMERMKVPKEKWKTFDYPLIEKKMSRADCIKYVQAFGLGTPPRSACYFCPYRSNAEWRYLKENSPEDFRLAVEFDRRIRRSVTKGLTAKFFVHSSRIPLNEVDFNKENEKQLSFLDECDGLCGV